MIMHWPQITLIVFAAIGVGIHMARNGQARDDSYAAIPRLIVVAIELWILYEGGFFGAVQ